MNELKQPATWQQAMKHAIRDSTSLGRALGIPLDMHLSSIGEQEFPVFVPLEFLARMRPADPYDPLLMQVLPLAEESVENAEYHQDPVGDGDVEVAPGLLHKYQGRVLLIMTGACAIHCRYCFRRHYPYGTAPKNMEQWLPALDYIAKDPSIQEVILSGGDPLTVSDGPLSQLISKLDSIDHLTRLRIHTRLPVVIPQRIDDSLCEILTQSRLAKWFVLHINHAQEIDNSVVVSIRKLQQLGTVINQSVLLKGINDSVKAQFELCQRLIDCGVIPYYLHQLDRVQRASHYETDSEEGQRIIEAIMKMLPGYGVPKYVREIAGQPSKTPIVECSDRLLKL